ncbi:hypothetical protein B0H13DRAFT_1886216 [Mycena leptocephala]|nr:hypothetical protein B0H13DRAFT_1886216 [Mycena leptocephala]
MYIDPRHLSPHIPALLRQRLGSAASVPRSAASIPHSASSVTALRPPVVRGCDYGGSRMDIGLHATTLAYLRLHLTTCEAVTTDIVTVVGLSQVANKVWDLASEQRDQGGGQGLQMAKRFEQWINQEMAEKGPGKSELREHSQNLTTEGLNANMISAVHLSSKKLNKVANTNVSPRSNQFFRDSARSFLGKVDGTLCFLGRRAIFKRLRSTRKNKVLRVYESDLASIISSALLRLGPRHGARIRFPVTLTNSLRLFAIPYRDLAVPGINDQVCLFIDPAGSHRAFTVCSELLAKMWEECADVGVLFVGELGFLRELDGTERTSTNGRGIKIQGN